LVLRSSPLPLLLRGCAMVGCRKPEAAVRSKLQETPRGKQSWRPSAPDPPSGGFDHAERSPSCASTRSSPSTFGGGTCGGSGGRSAEHRPGISAAATVGQQSATACCEEGWRYREVVGDDDGPAASSAAPVAARAQPPPSSKPRRPKAFAGAGSNRRNGKKKADSWRWEEIMGGSAMITPRPSPNRQCAPADAALVAVAAELQAFSLGESFREAEASEAGAAVSRAGAEAEAGLSEAVTEVEPGDLVLLGPGVPHEYRLCPAVVTKVAERHCTVVVLNSEQRIAVGECWPGFRDIAMVENRMLRLGTRVVVQGMQGQRTQRLNGFSGVVSLHPKQGHPTFVCKPSAPGQPQLTICVCFDDPEAAGERSALIEPRFLQPYDDAVQKMSNSLGDVMVRVASLMSPQPC